MAVTFGKQEYTICHRLVYYAHRCLLLRPRSWATRSQSYQSVSVNGMSEPDSELPSCIVHREESQRNGRFDHLDESHAGIKRTYRMYTTCRDAAEQYGDSSTENKLPKYYLRKGNRQYYGS